MGNIKGTLLERLADHTIGLVSPKSKKKRREYRRHFYKMDNDPVYAESMDILFKLRGYRNARTGKGQTPFLGNNDSPDSQIRNDLQSLASRNREVNRDDPIASGISWTFTTNVIGTGINPQARTGDDTKNDLLESVFNERKNNLSRADDMQYYEAQRMQYHSTLESGNIFVKAAKRNLLDPVWFETLEFDRLGTPMDSGADIIDGVEKDRNGVPVAYWFRKPSTQGTGTSVKDYDRVPAEFVTHLAFFKERPGQTMGVPQLHAVLQDLRDLDLLLIASLKRTQVAACLSVFIKSESDPDDLFDSTAEKYGYILDDTLEPGMMYKLYPDESIETLIPNFPTAEFKDFIIMLARRIGAAVGIPWQLVLRDFGESNYSSARTDLLEARSTFKMHQKWFYEKLLQWQWEWVLTDAKDRGDSRMATITPEDIKAVHWITPGWQWVDPKKDADATMLKMQMGLTTRQIECAAQGLDWEDVMDQQLREELAEQAARESMGLPPRTAQGEPEDNTNDNEGEEDE